MNGQTLVEKKRAWLNRVTEKVRHLHARTAAGAIEMGKLVLEVKARLPHGEFMAWAQAELPFGRQTAHNLMAVARTFGELKFPTLGNFEVMALYELSRISVPLDARTAAIEAAERGEQVTREKAAVFIAAAPRPDRPPRRGYFSTNPEVAANFAAIRGVYVDRFDRACTEGRFGALLGRDHPDPEVRERFAALYHELAKELFPEDFADHGLVPDGLQRFKPATVKAFAEMMMGG